MDKNYSILYAEDDCAVRKNYVIYLESYFDCIYQAENGKVALQIYIDKKPDLILIDINMPEMNGFEVIQKIREVDKNIPIIILSAHSDKEFLFQAIKLNLVDYLIKPINRNEFNLVIENTLSNLKVASSPQDENIISLIKSCHWDREKKLFFHKNKIIDLTKNERVLFELLLENKNEIISPTIISKYVWDNGSLINDASIRNLVKRVRKKLPIDIIQSIYGSGYILSY